jgi:hypothetical protein
MAPLLAQWQPAARPTAGESRADLFSGIGQPTRMSKAAETLARSCVRFDIDSGSYGRRPLRPWFKSRHHTHKGLPSSKPPVDQAEAATALSVTGRILRRGPYDAEI